MLKDKDFLYYLNIDYDRKYTCEYTCETICRCSTIYNERVTGIDVNSIGKYIYNMIYDNSKSSKRNESINTLLGITKDIEIYTIDRVIRKSLIYDTDIWNINIVNGYYGEELHNVQLNNTYADKLWKLLKSALSIDNLNERIEFLLKLEYDYILDELKEKNYRIITVNKSDILFPNKSHFNSVKEKKIDFYSDKKYDGIRGIVIKKDNKYRVIDGYHRLSKSEKENIKVIEAF